MSEEKNKGFTKLEDIITWQKSKTLAIDIYKITYEPLFSKDFGLKDQIRRAAVSVPSNIAEGFGRSTNRDKRNFLVISRGSVFECVAIFDYLKDLNQIDKTSFDKYYYYLEEISKMLLALIKHFEK